jgi:uncharacterized protein YbaP (TraB family)
MRTKPFNGNGERSKHPLWSLKAYFFIVAFFFPCCAGPASAASMLWEAKSPTATVYLLGSIHLAKPDMYPLPSVIEDSFTRSDNLVLEVNILEADQTAVLQKIMSEGLYAGEKTIKDDLTADVYDMLRNYLRKTGLPLESFLRMKPAILALTLESFESVRLGYSPELGVDMHFARKAEKTKPILELESIEEQTNLFLNIPDANVLLKYTILDISNFQEGLGAITDAWKEGDAEKLNDLLIGESLEENPDLNSVMDALIFKRNAKMAEKIRGYLSTDQTYFVVVGTAHLIGNRGIIKYIEDAGYPVRKF